MPSFPFIVNTLQNCGNLFSKELVIKKPWKCDTVKLKKGEAHGLNSSSF